MKASELLGRQSPLNSRALPSLVEVEKAIARVLSRWPNAVKEPEDRDRERIALEMLRRVQDWDWKDFKTSRAASAAIAVFDDERRDREDLAPVRTFYFEEIRKTSQKSFLTSMLWVYIGSFDNKAESTQHLAQALKVRKDDFGNNAQALLTALPDLLDPARAALSLAKVMGSSDDPYQAVKFLGFRTPHGSGLTAEAHDLFVQLLEPGLKQPKERDRLFKWLMPDTGTVLQTGAGLAIEALLKPWRHESPSDSLRSELSETIISTYNDPRTHSGGIWSGFDSELKALFLRWLTKEDMLFFCDMVSATQDSHMWPPRRDFWLSLYEDGRIDEAWVAFGSTAQRYARDRLTRSGVRNISRRFGRQHDRGGGTSLLVMRIGNKIVVDGCHSYKTHIFKRDDPQCPKLYDFNYYCDDIMRASNLSQSHGSARNGRLGPWENWVIRHV